MTIPIYQIDAFTNKVFGGNPASVCLLPYWLEDELMHKIACENNQAETAFIVRNSEVFELRWFTPTQEVDLCGHATLAAAYVIFFHLAYNHDEIRFKTLSGPVSISLGEKSMLALDFPNRPPEEVKIPEGFIEALGSWPTKVYKSRDYMAVFETEEQIRALTPDMDLLKKFDCLGIIATAPAKEGSEADFVSRFFAPRAGIPEDPATGSAHCTLIPYWAERLGKKEMLSHQLSKRGGELWCELKDDRVVIKGQAVLYLNGHIYL